VVLHGGGILAAQHDVRVGIVGIPMINCDPVQLGAQVRLHTLHQVARVATQIFDLCGVLGRDTVLVQDIVMLLTATVLVVNLIVDLSYHLLDPRLRGAPR